MTIDRIRPQDPIKAADQNALIAQVNRLARPTTTGRVEYGAAGLALPSPPGTLIGLFELSAGLTYPAAPDQAPYTQQAKAVWFDHGGETYGQTDQSPDSTLYHPTALRDAAGYYVGLPKMSAGSSVWAWWNRQSGRWEIIQPDRHYVYRGKLDAALSAGSYATVSIWLCAGGDGDAGVNVTAYDWLLPSGVSLDADTPVVVQWFADSRRWYVTGWQHVAQTVVTDYQYDAGTNTFQKKTNSLTVPAKGTESGWTDVFTATTMTVQSDIQVDGTNSELEKKTVELTVLEKAAESVWTVWHTGDTCS